MTERRDKIIVVCGPTASGKTYVAAELAKILNAEIISADSMQIYKELNIGTAKPSKDEMSGIPHHLIDMVSIRKAGTEVFSVAEYVKEAEKCVRDITGRKKRVIVCGGTGLYIDHFMKNTKFTEYENDIEYRLELESFSNERLYAMLAATDKKSAEKIHPNNKKRIIRALEIFKITGKTKSELDEISNSENTKYDFIKLELNYSDRNILYGRINKRVDMMTEAGLFDEARTLYDMGEEDNIRRIGAIGYVEIMDYFKGAYKFGEAVEKIKQHTRNYAKRQITWFKKDAGAIRIGMDADVREECVKKCLNFIEM